jgi:hypothetical protein
MHTQPRFILSLQQLWYYFLNYVYPNPSYQLSLWEETRAPGENPRLSTERWLFSNESVARIELTNSEVKALALTTAPQKRLMHAYNACAVGARI